MTACLNTDRGARTGAMAFGVLLAAQRGDVVGLRAVLQSDAAAVNLRDVLQVGERLAGWLAERWVGWAGGRAGG